MLYDPEQITFFAKTDARGKHVPFGIKAKDRTRHVYVIGKTGMGKSTLLENMAVQDIKNGNGLAFIDPHGQTAETILNYIPEERKSDVLYFAPFDTQYPVSFNVMEDVGPDRRHLVVSGLMSVFKKIWIDAWSARMEYILSNTLLALLEYPGSTLLGVNRMLSDKDYRKKVIDNIKDPSVRSFWVDEFLKYNERYMQEAGDAIKNKIGQFTNNPLIRNIVGQPHSSFDIRDIMDNKKILIMNLSKGLVGESNANLLGSMLTTRIYLAAMSRADLTPERMALAPNFYFYVDEFQSFANATFADILSEARKYKLNLTIAHQYIEQMEEEVRNAVFGNVGTIIAFRVGPFDAEVLETIFSPKFLATDIVNLGFAQVYLTLMIDGIGSSPFSATTLPPIPTASTSCRDMIVAESRQQFSKDRAEVEQMVLDFHLPVTKQAERRDAPEKEKDQKNIASSRPKPTSEREQSPSGRSEQSSSQSESRSAPRENSNRNASRSRDTTHPSSTSSDTQTDAPRTPSRTTTTHASASSAVPATSAPRTPAPREESSRREEFPRVQKTPSRTSAQGSPPRTQPEPGVDDLRAILKSMVSRHEDGTESGADAQGGDAHRQSKEQSAHTKKPTVPDPALKDAVAQALARSPSGEATEQESDIESKSDREVHRERSQSLEEVESVEHNQVGTSHTETLSTLHAPQPSVESEDPLSPKRIERMMRITGNDRPPLL